ncbi:RNA ligase [Bacillus smithii]|uniref:RNA ligase n=1 Tax=Bacillus smithii TaxID=1479 RepID=UPI002E1CDE0D|nr:RNA ligase [Bacillus smithii]MED4929023.1 RNA ligase [Bacillus smithii]
MRVLVLLRGVPGAGKTTWIKENGLEPYTLSADKIRLLFQSPELNEKGNYTISLKRDNSVWKLLLDLLEERMKHGHFTVIDATHSKQSMISKYRSLADKYRYRVYVVDFSDVPLEKLIIQNQQRPEYKQVPIEAIYKHYERMKTERVPSWVTVIKPHEFKEVMQYKPRNFDEYSRIHVIGDIHGCYTALQTYLNERLNEDELYIFAGDYLDRGTENAETLKFLIEIKDKSNVILLEGNHDKYIAQYGRNEETMSDVFNNITKPELDAVNIDKKSVRQLARRFNQLVYFTYNNRNYIVTHGGISDLPENLLYMSTEQLIKGVGNYEMDIDNIFSENTKGQNIIQIHGHRNLFRLPVKASRKSYNLEGGVERGEYLRAVTIDKDGIHTHEIKNNVFKVTEKQPVKINEDTISVEEFINHLDEHKYVKEQKLPDNISSFNFTKRAFDKKVWDDVTVKARGLFINTNTYEICSRSYNKFFNVEERKETKITTLANTLKFPVTVYEKENGYLGTVGYNSEKDELVFTSKSFTSKVQSADFAKWMEEMFHKTFNEDQENKIKKYIKENNVSLVFEVVLHERDPHIVEYHQDKLVLLDIVKRQMKYEKLSYEAVKAFGNMFDVEVKKLVRQFDNWVEFYSWYLNVTKDYATEKEGYVVEDNSGFMFKVKLPYYVFWKQMRRVKDNINDDILYRPFNDKKLDEYFNPLFNDFIDWAKKKDQEYLKNSPIITLRNKFYVV